MARTSLNLTLNWKFTSLIPLIITLKDMWFSSLDFVIVFSICLWKYIESRSCVFYVFRKLYIFSFVYSCPAIDMDKLKLFSAKKCLASWEHKMDLSTFFQTIMKEYILYAMHILKSKTCFRVWPTVLLHREIPVIIKNMTFVYE